MKNLFEYDYYRYYGAGFRFAGGTAHLLKDHSLWHLYLVRKFQASGTRFEKKLIRALIWRSKRKYGLEIPPDLTIGKGLYIGHAYNITINPRAILGNNINIHKGVTIGQENRGRRKGVPVIGSHVWIGINAVIVGNITIGDDVLIAPNAYVNTDVPAHSVVIGNPCKIVPRENATRAYINNIV